MKGFTRARFPSRSLNLSSLSRSGFTLGEVLISIVVLTLIVLFVEQVMRGATKITTTGNKRIDSDSQAQQVFDRMAADFDQMTKRTDVSYYLKATTPAMAGNDQMAFFAGVSGHYQSQTVSYNSDVSLVAYRINASTAPSSTSSYNRLERMGKGLVWNGVSGSTALTFLPLTISGTWPQATSSTAVDSDYGLAGSNVFRFEYYYLLNPSGPSAQSGLSAGPWADSNGSFRIRDIAAIIVAVGVIDPRSRGILTAEQMEKLAGTNGETSPFVDFTTGWSAGQLLATWQTTLLNDPEIATMPRQAIQNIRFYERYFPLPQR